MTTDIGREPKAVKSGCDEFEKRSAHHQPAKLPSITGK
jgi:hypothetical protein